MSASTMIKTLGECVDLKSLSKEQLDKLTGNDCLALETILLGKLVTGLGCLISYDGEKHGVRAGTFQNADDLAELLMSIGASVEAHGELVHIANEARYRLGIMNGASPL